LLQHNIETTLLHAVKSSSQSMQLLMGTGNDVLAWHGIGRIQSLER